MAKPIFLIQFPVNLEIEDDKFKELQTNLELKLTDWHVLFAQTRVSDVEFTAFSDKGATDVEVEKLKSMLLTQIGEPE